MKNLKPNLLTRIWKGINIGWNLPSLPKSVATFHNYPLIRILRVLGGISIVLFLPSSKSIESSFLFWGIFCLAMLQFIYILTINIIKICYIMYLWKTKKLEVRNSPLGHVASLSVKLVACVKGACVGGASTATILGLGFGTDKILEEEGYSPIFKKKLGKLVGNILSNLGYESNTEYIELKKQMLETKQTTSNINDLQEIVKEMENNKSFSGISEDIKQFNKEFMNELNKEKQLKEVANSKILKELKKIKDK